MILQIDSTTLRTYLSNIQTEVRGETPLLNKLAPHLYAAEQWLIRNILSEDMLREIAGASEPSDTQADATDAADQGASVATVANTATDSADYDVTAIRQPLTAFIIYRAYAAALPSLDLVLTPNGYAVVSNNTLAPASRQRVESLLSSALNLAVNALDDTLIILQTSAIWCRSVYGKWFGGSLFPVPSELCRLTGDTLTWQKYVELRSQCIDCEDSLAEEYISPELTAALRWRRLTGTLLDADTRLIDGIRRQVLDMLADKPINGRKMYDLVQYIRMQSDIYPQWHNSATAELFAPPKYTNTKEAKGYWF